MEINLILLALIFSVVAFFYSMVGFGGGSSYIALLILFAIPHTDAPLIALTCNLIVVTGGVIYFYRGGHFNKKLLLPFLITSVPLAYLGGTIPIEKEIYQLILAICLFLASVKMLFFRKNNYIEFNEITYPPQIISLTVGGLLGFISGLIGIGGGIFLAPILYTFKWGRPKEIATVAAAFIFVNSLAGIFGQLTKIQDYNIHTNYWPLFVAVFIMGQVGSYLGSFRVKQRKVEVFTGILILVVSARLMANII